MKNKRRHNAPVWLYGVFGVFFILICFFMKGYFTAPDGLLYLSSVISMPESTQLIIKEKFTQWRQKLNADFDNYILLQNDGSVTELETRRNFSDLTLTPDDIIETIENELKNFTYKYDGEVREETYIEYQATDSFDKTYVRNVTVNSEIDVGAIIQSGCKLPVDDYSKPTVLIYHTHSTECYNPSADGKFATEYPSRNTDKKQNMVRVGEEIAAVLAAKGIGVVHDTNIYDEVYTGAYDKSRKGVEAALAKYPSIVITLDIHRDAIYYDDLTRVKPVAEINEKKAAQMMIITGAEGGNVKEFNNWETNLSFALNLQNAVNTEYENLMKPVYFCNRKYNMDLTPYSLLIEVGTDANTLEEAAYSARLLASSLADFIKNNGDKNE